MKTAQLIAFTSIYLFASCTGNSDKPAAIAPPAAKSELLVKASAIFQPLPATAENELNPITPAKVALGKVLYFDTRLSLKGNNSCNSCHNLTTFGVDNEAFSTGDAGKPGGRNSPTVFNAAVHAMQFWDGRSKTVEDQAGLPMMNPVEMAIPNKEFIEKRLAAIPLYQEQFKAAFPQEKSPLNLTNITYAIAAFERTLLTPSRFDTFLQGDETALTASEKEGLSTFMSVGCINCHTGVGVGGNMMMKFGLLNDYHTLTGSSNGDNGLMDLTKNASDKDMFKVSSLRNAEKTGPYFHDGSVASLATAVKIMGKTQLNKELNEEQIKGIVSFLGALTADIPADVKVKPAAL
jgi:cytochrome c peroxidase